MKAFFFSLLCTYFVCYGLAAADEVTGIDAAIDALMVVGEQDIRESSTNIEDISSNSDESAAILSKPGTRVVTNVGDAVVISRAELQAWMNQQHQQSIQAEVISKQVDNQLWTTVLLAVVWLITFVLMINFMHRQNSRDYVNVLGLNLIIFATLFMVLVVETDQQLTAGAGILGAIAGYLFRAMQSESEVIRVVEASTTATAEKPS